MDHAEAIRAMATERYLLDELPPDVREQFEEHLFGCHECAMDVRAGAVFLEQGKATFADSGASGVPAVVQPRPGRFAWWRPAFAIPAFACLLVLIGYQNLVTYPALKSVVAQARKPQVLAVAPLVGAATRGTNVPAVTVAPGESFLLPLDIPPQNGFASYRIELHNPSDGVEWSLVVSAEAARSSLPIRAPGVAKGGQYQVVIIGLNPQGEKIAELARYPFELQLAKPANSEP